MELKVFSRSKKLNRLSEIRGWFFFKRIVFFFGLVTALLHLLVFQMIEIINAGVSELVFLKGKDYDNGYSRTVLEESGIKYTLLIP